MSVKRPSGEHHVAYDAMAAHLKEATNAAGVGNDPVACFGQHEFRIFSSDTNVAKKSSLEGTTDGPTLNGDNDGSIEIK